ncbi:MAG: PIG-L family deacetylase [Ktedonobacteraceae bacterium]|nr:PIG-L family deacetylase [Ktedonobacteraceae bacterium]
MTQPLKLMCILAHPDDESLGTGGILAKYATEGIETYLITATRGERGWYGDEREHPGLDILGRTREAELQAAAKVLGIQQVHFLDYMDGDLDQAHPAEIIAKIVGYLRRVKPDVVVTFDAEGSYGHPDHIAISQFTTAAIMEAANPSSSYYQDLPAHSVAKLYYMAATKEMLAVYQSVFGELVMHIDDVERRGQGWLNWAITTKIDAEPYWQTVWQAVHCHRSQIPAYSRLEQVSEAQHKVLWNSQTYYRVFSRVNGGRKMEHDLFEGLR